MSTNECTHKYTKQNIQEKFFDVSHLVTMHKETMPASSTASAEVPLGIKQCTFLSSQILKTMTMWRLHDQKKKKKALLLNKPKQQCKTHTQLSSSCKRIKNKQANNRQIKHRQHTHTQEREIKSKNNLWTPIRTTHKKTDTGQSVKHEEEAAVR